MFCFAVGLLCVFGVDILVGVVCSNTLCLICAGCFACDRVFCDGCGGGCATGGFIADVLWVV